jgi:hypothetical protein
MDGVQSCCREREIDYRLTRTDQPFDVTLSALVAAQAGRAK